MSARGPTHDVGLARRGLAIYFAILLPLSAVFEALMILGNLSWFWALMWTPAAASVVARLVLREGFADVSFRIGGSTGVERYRAGADIPYHHWHSVPWDWFATQVSREVPCDWRRV